MNDRTPITHDLKTETPYFDATLRGDKTLEIRRNDRDFRVGDWLRLREYDRTTNVYSGRAVTVTVTHILSGAPYVPKGYVAMSVRRELTDERLAELRRIAEVPPEIVDTACPVCDEPRLWCWCDGEKGGGNS